MVQASHDFFEPIEYDIKYSFCMLSAATGKNVAVDKGLIVFVDVLPPPGLHDIQECLVSFYKPFANIDSLGFVLKAIVVIKFGSLWNPS